MEKDTSEYLTIEEAFSQLNQEDLIAKFVDETLRPSIWSDRLVQICEWEDDPVGDLMAPVGDDDGFHEFLQIKAQWLYLRNPIYDGPGKLSYRIASTDRDALWPKNGDIPPYPTWFVSTKPITIKELKKNGVILLRELSGHSLSHSLPPADAAEVLPGDEEDLPPELDAALVIHRLLRTNGGGTESTFKKSALLELRKMQPEFTEAALERIATVINISKAPGRKKKNS